MIGFLALLCFALSAGVSWLVKKAGILDHPNARSSHSAPTPRGGGLGVIAALGLVCLFAVSFYGEDEVVALLVAALGFGLLGLGDDLLALGTRIKFGVIILLSIGIVWLAGPVALIGITETMSIELPIWLGLMGCVLWLFVASNAANFMDGSDGLTVAAFVPAGLGMFVMADGGASLVGLAMAAGLAGFAVFNVPRAYLFLGDVGSLTIGAVFATASLLAINSGVSVWIYPLLILPILADVLLTLVGKVRNRIGFLSPHRTHAYQLLLRMGWPHWRVALAYFMASASCAVLAFISETTGGFVPFLAFVIAVIAATVLHMLVRSMARKAGLDLKA